MKRILSLAGLLALVWFVPTGAQAYKTDKTHSSDRFQLRHFFTQFQGQFSRFSGKLTFNPKNLKATKLKATVFIKSVNTNNKKRDAHLQAKDYFDAAKYPKMTFVSSGVSKVKGNVFWLKGTLTIRNKSLPTTFKVKFLGEMKKKDRWGNYRSGFSASTKINRIKFGVGGKNMTLGSKVKIILNIEATRR